MFGTGQGSGASPAVWLTLSTVLLSSLKTQSIKGMTFRNPSASLMVEQHSDAFVDFTQNGLNDEGMNTPWAIDELLSRLEDMSKRGKASFL